MEKIKLPPTSKGLKLSPKLMKLGGIESGKPISVEFYRSYIKIFQEELAKEDVEDIAINYAFENYGENVAIKTPKKRKNKWMITLILDYTGKKIGRMEIDENGEILKAPSKAELLKKVQQDEAKS